MTYLLILSIRYNLVAVKLFTEDLVKTSLVLDYYIVPLLFYDVAKHHLSLCIPHLFCYTQNIVFETAILFCFLRILDFSYYLWEHTRVHWDWKPDLFVWKTLQKPASALHPYYRISLYHLWYNCVNLLFSRDIQLLL